MTQSTLKKRIFQALDNTKDDEILQAVYTILKRTVIEQEATSLTTAQKKDLDQRLAEHKSGTLKYYTLEEVKKATLKSLKNKR